MVQEILAKLRQEETAFSDYLALTQQMVGKELEQIEILLAKRERKKGEIEGIESGLRELTESDLSLRELLRCRGDRSTLTGDAAMIYDAAAPVMALVGHIRDLEEQIREQMERNKAALLEKIDEMAQSNTAQAARFAGYEETYLQLDKKM